MPQAVDFTCTVSDEGHLPKTRRKFIQQTLGLYAGRDVRIRITTPKRSSAANRYYWGVVIQTIREGLMNAGRPVSAEVLHEHFKREYLPARVVEVFGTTHVLPGSTAELDSTTFHDYIEAIKTDEAVIELGVYIPEPGEYGESKWRSHALVEMA